MPVLKDKDYCYLSCPSSAYVLPQTKKLVMPNPYKARDLRETNGIDYDYEYDTWFENVDGIYSLNGQFAVTASEPCEGGTFVMGLDDEVLLFNIDGPGDVIRGRWKCQIEQWERMWESSFGSTIAHIGDDVT